MDRLGFVFLAMVVAPAAGAQSLEGDRFSLSLGAFITDRDTATRLDSSAGDGTDIDFEDDLGLASSDTVFRVDAYFRFTAKHRIDFSTFDLSRDSTKRIETDIRWGDEEYAVDTRIKAEFDLTIYKAAYSYSFVSNETSEVGAMLGLYVADVGTSLSEESLGRAEVGELTAPLPVIGLRGERKLSDHWTIRASGEFFFVDYEGIDGSLVDLYAGIDYRLYDHLSIGLGYNTVSIDVDASKARFDGSLDWQYAGALLFLKLTF
jgi:hypothetical protein